MSLFGKLIGAAAKKVLASAVEAARQKKEPVPQSRVQANPVPAAGGPTPAPFSTEGAVYVGDTMPPEENQYSFAGSYVDYFDHVFREEYPSYRITHEPARGRQATIFTFTDPAGGTALVVELLRETSRAKKLRADCAAAGIPYLRFYYNHAGWWNTRSYVVRRVNTALGR